MTIAIDTVITDLADANSCCTKGHPLVTGRNALFYSEKKLNHSDMCGGRTFFPLIDVERVAVAFAQCLEVVSKPQIAPKAKARTDEKAQHTLGYVSILRRSATQRFGVRWGFETTSIQLSIPESKCKPIM